MIAALDIGATAVKAGLVSPECELVVTRERLVPAGQDAKKFLDFILRTVRSMLEHSDASALTAVGAGSCGVIREGSILYSPNTAWKSLPLREALQARLQVPVAVMNDADAFGLGVYHYELKGKYRGVCALTLGSGLGGSLIGPNGAVAGFTGISPEIGHMKVRAGGPKCKCGGRGCLEAYVGKKAIITAYRRYGGKADVATPQDVFDAYKRGDEAAIRAFANMGFYLGVGIANIFNLCAPQAVVLGGGVSRAAPAFMPALRESLADSVLKGLGGPPRVVVSKLRHRANLLGAAHQAMRLQEAGTVLE